MQNKHIEREREDAGELRAMSLARQRGRGAIPREWINMSQKIVPRRHKAQKEPNGF